MSTLNSSRFLYLSIAYFIFIIYGSFLPFEYQSKDLDDAWFSFINIQYLNLGAQSRADWIANIVLYIPLTFSLAAYFTFNNQPFVQRFFIILFILAISITLAISIEFGQQFFPQRTVSQNDLIAEIIGSIVGLLIWFGLRKQFVAIVTLITQGGKGALIACSIIYTLGYIAISFFPYDFVTSFQELENKIASGDDAFFISSSCNGIIRCTTKLVIEVILVIPLGILFSIALKHHPARLTAVILIGFILGIIIESIQLFIINGIAQGVSVFTRTIGIGVGEAIYNKIRYIKKPIFRINFKKYILLFTFPYILLLPLLNGWNIVDQDSISTLAEKFNDINWIPFYYHYFTTEAVALNSLLIIFVLYFPVGIIVWLLNYNYHYKASSAHKLLPGLCAVSLCFIMEMGKLFFSIKHPDPTNLLISFVSASIAFSLIETMSKWWQQQ